jgi:hypothetical protein
MGGIEPPSEVKRSIKIYKRRQFFPPEGGFKFKQPETDKTCSNRSSMVSGPWRSDQFPYPAVDHTLLPSAGPTVSGCLLKLKLEKECSMEILHCEMSLHLSLVTRSLTPRRSLRSYEGRCEIRADSACLNRLFHPSMPIIPLTNYHESERMMRMDYS